MTVFDRAHNAVLDVLLWLLYIGTYFTIPMLCKDRISAIQEVEHVGLVARLHWLDRRLLTSRRFSASDMCLDVYLDRRPIVRIVAQLTWPVYPRGWRYNLHTYVRYSGEADAEDYDAPFYISPDPGSRRPRLIIPVCVDNTRELWTAGDAICETQSRAELLETIQTKLLLTKI